MKKYILGSTILVTLAIVAIFVTSSGIFSNVAKAAPGVMVPLKGWAWSSNIGWISFNSTDANTGSGGTGNSPVAYSVKISTSSDGTIGTLSEYAWSSNVGWISFNSTDLTDCAGIAVTANVDMNTGYVSGWARVLSAKNNPANSGGWDGCIKLAEPNNGLLFPTGHTNGSRGVSYNRQTGRFDGYGWGDMVMGWLQFSPTIAPATVCPGCVESPPPMTYDLTVSKNGIGTGTVSGSGIDCGSTCRKNGITNNTDITLTATADSGSTFVGWSGCTSEFGTSCSVTMNGNKSVTATFNTTGTPPGTLSCTVPTNATLCSGSINDPNENPNGSKTTLIQNTATCPAPTTYCVYQCNAGFKINGNKCVFSSTEEI